MTATEEVGGPGTCKHRPVSNGWSQSWSRGVGHQRPVAWCGHCKALVQMDDEWIAKFASRGQKFAEVGTKADGL